MSDSAIREVAKQRPTVVMNRVVGQVPSVTSDNVRAIKHAVEHLADSGIKAISYLAGPQASWADGMRWRGLVEAGHELELRVHRIGPCVPTMIGGIRAAERWLQNPTGGVIAYNDLIAIGFIRAVRKAGQHVPEDVQVIGFDNILDAALLEPRLTTIASPVVSLGSAAVNHCRHQDRPRPAGWQQLARTGACRPEVGPMAPTGLSRPATRRQRPCGETAHRHLTEVAGPPDEEEGTTDVDPFRIL